MDFLLHTGVTRLDTPSEKAKVEGARLGGRETHSLPGGETGEEMPGGETGEEMPGGEMGEEMPGEMTCPTNT